MSDDKKITTSAGSKESNSAMLNSLLELLVGHAIRGTPTSVNAYQIIPDLSQTIDDFNGKDEAKAIVMLSNLNVTGVLHNWPVELKIQIVSQHLVRAVHDWWLIHVQTITE